MKIAITGGKGGTGKSVVATALAVQLAKKHKVLLLDADVDCPNDHIILDITRKKVENIMQLIPKWDFKKCKKCGKCAEVCKENAIVFVKDHYPIFVPDLCIGCTACMIACPTKAIGKTKKKIGTVYKGKNYGVEFISAETEIGVEEESPIVNAMKKYSAKSESEYDFVLVDTSPGTHCNVIAALQNCDLALAVTEPTPLGQHDLKLILQLLKLLKVPTKIVLNRADIGKKELIKKVAQTHETEIIGEIPYKKEIIEAYSQAKPIEHESIRKLASCLEVENERNLSA